MHVLSAVLAYHALVTLAFSPMLMFAPERLMKVGRKGAVADAKKRDDAPSTSTRPDTKTLVWRICGIWVFYGGLMSLYATGYFSAVTNEVQVFVTGGLMLTHLAESQVKMYYTGNQLLNLHVCILLLAGLLHNYFK
ncbi:hypothetical protein SARC_02921 [Sphaeroforma arctica JP610]|uniref:Uncharacterized protein n=1 Tax=Sphaeroforma arctica JP610 TaxID=667725 RepID=A0A0L0G765_9EUKA|nr:hypothetical protein SARC_02921 [Sphaeroforma arctica JP610]KNC84882.1 hypothetical protein SARC_02921 [Sphaeroforma arctica JP610]|eukprot:XP_014158784.1 hypothetical protein SARC_02921 [Sphaeroforma arctica JP610]